MHKSVLLNESINSLSIKQDGIYVDCTLGYGGHSAEILKKIKKGFLFAFDQDDRAIELSSGKLKEIGTNFEIIKSNFENIKEELNSRDIKKVDGILFDLGVSSMQLDEGERGFSYHQDAKLDMRMNQDNDLSAYEVVNEYELDKLMDIFYKYGEEKYAKSIAKNIIKKRPIETTIELVEIIKESVPFKYKKDKHPARKVFQAIRIEVNNELEVLEKALKDSIELLDKDGRLAVITFHSLEDRICKNIFRENSEVDEKVKGLPEIPEEYLPIVEIVNKKLKPTSKEITDNKRSRSAILRVIKKI